MLRFARTPKAARRKLPAFNILEDRTVPTLLGQQLFPADNPWNQRIADAPVAANSSAIINNITTRYGNGRLHPDFSQDFYGNADLYGIPYNIVHGNSTPLVSVVLDAYPDESDPIPAPIPATVVLEGDFQNGPRFGVNNRGDSHLLLYDVDINIAYEFYRMSRPSENSDGQWHADQQSVWDFNTNSFRTLGWTSADAAGLPILPGLVRPDEALPVSQGGQGVINHAIRFTLQNAIVLDQFIYPGSHTANPGNNNPSIQPPMGARFRLKSSVDISLLNPQSRIVAQAMKDYGMILADNGSNFYFSGASSSVDASNQLTLTWNDDDIQSSTRGLKSLRYADFEVVDLTPVVNDLSVHSGPAGTSVTIVGQNFSGAAGQLGVKFGNVAATSVTVVSDTQIVAIAPPGTGAVNVRVQSGVTTAPNTDNIKNTIFGYGISPIATNGVFTYTAGNVSTTTTLTANPNATTGGTLVTFTATVAPSPGNLGTVTFRDGGTALASNVALVGGIATFQTSTLSVGTHSMSADFSGATGYAASSSSPLSFVVSARTPPPTIFSVRTNGNIPGLVGIQHSRIASIVITFDRPVQLDANAIALALHTNGVAFDGVAQPAGIGALPTSLIVTSADNIAWTVTFTGNTDPGADGFSSLRDGVYDLNIAAQYVHPLGSPSVNMAANFTTTFHRLFGDTDATVTTGSDMFAVVNTADNLTFRNSFNNSTNYLAALDFQGDGSIVTDDNLQFRSRFNKVLSWRP